MNHFKIKLNAFSDQQHLNLQCMADRCVYIEIENFLYL